jgi:hypothetical protein
VSKTDLRKVRKLRFVSAIRQLARSLPRRPSCSRVAVNLLLGRVDAMGLFIYRQTVDVLLYREILICGEPF